MSNSILEEINQDVGLNDAFFERIHEQYRTKNGYSILMDVKRKFEEIGRYDTFEYAYLDFLERNYPDDWSLVYDVLRAGQNKSGNMVVCDNGTARPVKKRKKLHYMTAQELLSADLPPVEYIVDVIISKGLVILSAKSKIGKSWFALDLAIAVASGADFLGFNTTQGEVLYIDLENSKALTQQRLVRLLNGAEAPNGLTIVNDYSTMNDTFLEDITEYLKQNPKVSLVIVDVFQKIKKSKSNNKADYDDIYENFTPLKELAEKYSMTFSGSDYTGRFIGIGMGCAVLLQFVVQNLFVTNVAFIASIVISAAVLVYFVIKPPKDWMFENPLPYSSENKTDKKEVSILIVATILMSLVIGLIDGVVVAKHAEGSLSVSSYARLFYALSLPVAGFVADIKKRKYLSIVTVCTLFISTISTALMSASGTFFSATAFMYVYSGFYVMFLTISFIDLAPRTKRPEFWASMGRVIRSLTTAFTAIPVVGLFEQFGSIALVAGSCILSVMTLLVLFRSISFSILPQESAKETSDDASAPLTREEVIQAYAKHYGFTPRESEVFEKLISTEDGTQQIADSLYISRRVLQRYIAAIYEKTDTKSRIGLFQNFIAFNK